jgi:hypothetical protein
MKGVVVCLVLAGCYHDSPPPPLAPPANHVDEAPPRPPPPPPSTDSPWIQSVADAGLPPDCLDYLRAIEKLADCDKLPQASKDALKTSAQSMVDSWKDASSMPPEAQKAMADACRQAADAVNQTSDVCK